MGEDIKTTVEGVPGNSDAELITQLADVEPPKRPDVTPVQWTVLLGVAIQFSRAFGIWDPTPDQEEALNVATGALVGLGLGDAVLRGFRNLGNR